MSIQSFLKLNEEDSGYSVKEISLDETKHFILNIHYAKRLPSVSFAYGLINNGNLVGIITYGTPANPFLCSHICGDKYKENVIELNRLCLLENKKNEASMLVGRSLQMLPKPKIVVSYADSDQNHIGVVYQATNFLFTGTTKERTDMASHEGKHSRHSLGDKTKRQKRSAKHRYVFFVGSKSETKKMKTAFTYDVMPYPKKKKEFIAEQVSEKTRVDPIDESKVKALGSAPFVLFEADDDGMPLPKPPSV